MNLLYLHLFPDYQKNFDIDINLLNRDPSLLPVILDLLSNPRVQCSRCNGGDETKTWFDDVCKVKYRVRHGGVNLAFVPIGSLQRSGLSFDGTSWPEDDAAGYLDHSPSLALFMNLSIP
jgi:hypothetical protein